MATIKAGRYHTSHGQDTGCAKKQKKREKMWQSHVREKGEKGEYISAVGMKSHQ